MQFLSSERRLGEQSFRLTPKICSPARSLQRLQTISSSISPVRKRGNRVPCNRYPWQLNGDRSPFNRCHGGEETCGGEHSPLARTLAKVSSSPRQYPSLVCGRGQVVFNLREAIDCRRRPIVSLARLLSAGSTFVGCGRSLAERCRAHKKERKNPAKH